MLPTRALVKECLQVSLFSLLLGTAMLVVFFFANDLIIVALISVPTISIVGRYTT